MIGRLLRKPLRGPPPCTAARTACAVQMPDASCRKPWRQEGSARDELVCATYASTPYFLRVLRLMAWRTAQSAAPACASTRHPIVCSALKQSKGSQGHSVEVASMPLFALQPEETAVALALPAATLRVARTYAIGALDTTFNIVANVKEQLLGKPQPLFAQPLDGKVGN